MKRVLALMLATLMLLLSFAACTPADTPDDETTNTSSNTDEVTTPEQTTAPTPTTPAEPENQILLADLSDYKIIRPEDSTVTVYNLATSLKNALKELDGAPNCELKTDTVKEGFPQLSVGEYEILIGNTNREETLTYKESLRSDDYGYTIIGKKIVIFGYKTETLEKAVEDFISNVVEKKFSDGVFMTASESDIVKGHYEVNKVSVEGHSIKKCVIVYPAKASREADAAKLLCDYLLDATGYYVPYQSDAVATETGTYEILIGNTNRGEGITVPEDLLASDAYIASDNTAVLVTGGGDSGFYHALNLFKAMFEIDNDEIAVKVDAPIRENSETATIKSMSFNLWVGGTSVNKDRVVQMIKLYMPDVLGVQEANETWMGILKKGLAENYAWVGTGRDNGTGEYSAIFYRKDLFTCLGSDTKWLSSTPSVTSKVEGSLCNRVATYAILSRKSDGKTFVHVNTHLDHGPDAVREAQAEILVDLVKDFTKQYPVLMTGDFNCTPSSAAYSKIIAGGFANASTVAEKTTSGGYTFHQSYKSDTGGAEIDFFFVQGNLTVTRYHICKEQIDDAYPSDHYPVYIEYLLQ